MKIGELLKEYRYSKRIPIRKLAKELGVNISTLSRIENGKVSNARSLSKILRWML